MFEQYVKLFHLGWIEPWLVEAMAMIFGAVLIMLAVVKTIDFLNGEDR